MRVPDGLRGTIVTVAGGRRPARHLLQFGAISAERRPIARRSSPAITESTDQRRHHGGRCAAPPTTRTNARTTAGSSSASRIRGCASPSSTEARRAPSKPPGCRSRRCRRRTSRSCGGHYRGVASGRLRSCLRAPRPRLSSRRCLRVCAGLPGDYVGEEALPGPVRSSAIREPSRRGTQSSAERASVDAGDSVVVVGRRSGTRHGQRGADVEHRVEPSAHVRDGKVVRDAGSSTTEPRPSKPPGCRSRRCRRRTSSLLNPRVRSGRPRTARDLGREEPP